MRRCDHRPGAPLRRGAAPRNTAIRQLPDRGYSASHIYEISCRKLDRLKRSSSQPAEGTGRVKRLKSPQSTQRHRMQRSSSERLEIRSLPAVTHSLLSDLDHSPARCLRQLPLAALPSTRAIPGRDVFHVIHPYRSIRGRRRICYSGRVDLSTLANVATASTVLTGVAFGLVECAGLGAIARKCSTESRI